VKLWVAEHDETFKPYCFVCWGSEEGLADERYHPVEDVMRRVACHLEGTAIGAPVVEAPSISSDWDRSVGSRCSAQREVVNVRRPRDKTPGEFRNTSFVTVKGGFTFVLPIRDHRETCPLHFPTLAKFSSNFHAFCSEGFTKRVDILPELAR
jgi:hypothetical protein